MRTSSLIVVLALAGCSGKKDQPKASEPVGSAGSAAAPAASASVQIFVNDAPVGTIAIEQIKLWPRLDALVPTSARHLGSWQDLTFKAANPQPLHAPSASYPDFVPALFPGDDGKPAFGLFDPVELAKHGKPAAARQDDVSEIRIKMSEGTRGQNEQGNAADADPMAIKVAIKTSKGESTLEGAKLLAVPREPEPGGKDLKGWTLATLLKTAGVDHYEKVILTDAAGLNLTLEKQDLDPAASIPYIKLNRQGALRVKIYKKQGDSWQPSGDLRGLVRVEILK
ncbi:MAG: hypothetical protein JO257_15555 [Deltaproteobacteria bacterium]|nr:hypothetical protein [Deltaproteobacteria bacterium]